jgi:glycosyl transferase family 87
MKTGIGLADARVAPPGTSRRVWLRVWALMAVINLLAGVIISSRPDRQADLDSMRRWGHGWLVEGTNIYQAPGEAPDYPPHAIVVLSPLGLLTPNRAVAVWAAFNLALAVLSVYLTVHAARPGHGGALANVAMPMLMFLCWGGFRTLLQFSLLTLTCGLASIVLADRRPAWSGCSLGLALMKPQVAVPFVLWALFTRRWRSLAVAVSIVAVGFLLYCVRAVAAPLGVVTSYLAILRVIYAGDAYAGDANGLVGLASVRPLVALAVSRTATVNAVAGGIAFVLLAGICALGLAEGRRRPSVMYSAPALAGIWSLLTFYHLTYGFILLLPTAALLLWAEEPDSQAVRTRIFWLLQAALMFDAPGLWRWLGPVSPAATAPGMVLLNSDRVLTIALFVSMTALALRRCDRFRLVKSGGGDHGEQDGAGGHS